MSAQGQCGAIRFGQVQSESRTGPHVIFEKSRHTITCPARKSEIILVTRGKEFT